MVTATVKPLDSDPTELAQIVLYANPVVLLAKRDKANAKVGEVLTSNSTNSYGAPAATTSATIQVALPIKETSSLSANQPPSAEPRTGTAYKAQLYGKTDEVKFDGRDVKESSGGKGSTTCITAGITVPQIVSFFANPQLSGGCWTVAGPAGCGINNAVGDYSGQSNTYGDDVILIPKLWLPGILYRNKHGCSVTYTQDMAITCSTTSGPSYCKYWNNKIVLTIKPGKNLYDGTASATRTGGPAS